jgi:NTP pyrophosphatase (non-canonical NTP hydrolase)
MNSEIEMVREFMVKHNHDIAVALPEHVNVELHMVADRLDAFAVQLESRMETTFDPRVIRVQLMCEELGETIRAMASGDEVLLLDGLSDLLYVVLGTAIAFDMPVVEAFAEVHQSNMTKAGGDQRVRNKGDEWTPPDIGQILFDHRSTT